MLKVIWKRRRINEFTKKQSTEIAEHQDLEEVQAIFHGGRYGFP